jgi:hypothetical protein
VKQPAAALLPLSCCARNCGVQKRKRADGKMAFASATERHALALARALAGRAFSTTHSEPEYSAPIWLNPFVYDL